MQSVKLIKKCVLSAMVAAFLGTAVSVEHFLAYGSRVLRASTVSSAADGAPGPTFDDVTKPPGNDGTDTAWGG